MNDPVTYMSILVVLVLLILWSATQLQEIYDTWKFYKNQRQTLLANDWIVCNIQKLTLFSILLLVCVIALFHWVALPTYYALYAG